MTELLAKLWRDVDPATLGVLVVFWMRWELWTRSHNRTHQELELRNPRKAHAH